MRKQSEKHVKYPDAALAKALRNALKVKAADPGRAQIVYQRAFDLVQRRGSVSPITLHRLGPDAQDRQKHIDRARWILSSALSMGTIAPDYREGLADCAHYFNAGRRRRPPLTPKARPLTARQAEVVQIVGECRGDLAEAARRLGIDRKTVKESYDAGNRKLGIRAMPKPKTVALPVDRRGGITVAKDRRW